MKLKKLVAGTLAFGILGMGAIGFGTQAGAEEVTLDQPGWQTIGTDSVAPTTSYTMTTGYKLSGGGNIGFQVPKHTAGTFVTTEDFKEPALEVTLWSDNGAGTEVDEEIGSFVYYPKRMTGTLTKSTNIQEYVDGTNNQAEIYAVYTANYNAPGFTATVLD